MRLSIPPPMDVAAALSGKRILITGSTGFLAKVLLEKILRSVPNIGHIVLLIRGDEGKDGRDRFEREIATSSVFERLRAEQPDWLALAFAQRIECVTGEVTQPNFGMSLPAFSALARRIDLVINAAASVNFREALDQALAINTMSVQHIAELARINNAPLIHVSTCYVNGYHRGDMREENLGAARVTLARHADGHFDVDALLQNLQQKIAAIKANTRDMDQLRQRLTALGIAEANEHGWNDTYTFTKWLGEQLALRAMRSRTLTIVRPSIIESTLQEPVPGWLEGVKVADAIILAYARGKTSIFPAKRQQVIDIIPADLVANSIILAATEALSHSGATRIYQACSGTANPITVGRVIDLIQTESQRHWQQYERLFYHAPQQAFRVVSRPTFLLLLRAMGLGASIWGGLRRLLGAGDWPKLEALRTTQLLALTFSFYTAPRYVFHNQSLLALAQRFSPADQQRYAVDPSLIDWQDYLCRIHMAGLNRYALRPRAARPAPASAAAAAAAAAATATPTPVKI